MIIRKHLATSVIAAAALTIASLAPAAASQPLFSGTLTCLDAITGEARDLNPVEDATPREIATWRTYWNKSGFCVNGSFDTSNLTQA